jgi:peptide/nickel transport system permease protein
MSVRTVPALADASRPTRRRPGNLTAALSVGWLGLLVVSVVVLSRLLGLDPLALSATDRLQGPSLAHWLGTDDLGRDLLARSLDGARISLGIGIGSTLMAALIGVPLGMIAGNYRDRPVERIIGFGVDVVLAFPGLVLALALAAFLGASITNVIIAITVPLIPVFVRLARAQTLSVYTREFIEASRIIGTPLPSIMWREVIPNILPTLLAFGLVTVGRSILIEGGLSFLGIGVPPPQPTWGSMIDKGRLYLVSHPLIILVPSAFLMLTILSTNLLAERFLSDKSHVGVGT